MVVSLMLSGCGGGNSSPNTSTQGINKTTDSVAPSQPTSLAAINIASTDLSLTWNPSTDDVGVVGYEVWRNDAKITTVTTTSYHDSGLVAGTTYSYKVVARDAAGNTAVSAPVSATTSTLTILPNATVTIPANAKVGNVVAVSVDPGTTPLLGQMSIFPLNHFSETTGLPTGQPVERFDICQGGRCTTSSTIDYTIPTTWPTGSYFFCMTSPGVSCGKMEVTNDTAMVDQGVCTAVDIQGASDQKIDVVFIADNYSAADISSFNQKVSDYRAALLAVAPFSTSAQKFNFWKVERLGPLQKDGDYVIPLRDLWSTMVSRCGGGPDMVVVVEGPGYSGAGRPTGTAGETPQWLFITNSYDGQTFVHEFGHAFANLGDEYMNSTVYLNDPSISVRPNVDQAFCPQWCSGMPNFSATVPGTSFSCWSAWETFNTCIGKIPAGERSGAAVDACWTEAGDMHNGWLAGIWRCDFGTGCEPGTGCFWSAGKATNLFRPTDESIMSGGTLATGFNPPSLDAIKSRLNQYP